MVISDISTLLKKMEPVLSEKTYFICSTENPTQDLLSKSLGVFKENEGITLILEQKDIPQTPLKKSPPQALITLNVYSDLAAVGFLAAITSKLAENGISVNAISAYYHDHLFVPKEFGEKAVEILKTLQKVHK
jgi:hypothetical protein